MHIRAHRYTLTRRDGGRREGALLRVNGGFADLHPWPELGDAPLDAQLAMLARGETTPLSRAALHWAAVDGEARTRGVSLFDGLTIPLSHWPGNDPPAAFDTVKMKGTMDVPERVRIRIDFNGRLSPEEVLFVAAELPRERVDFLEDPCPYDEVLWRELSAKIRIRFALDRFEGVADVLVHKPALQSAFPNHPDVVVTSYMDHPLGQFTAAYVAATHRVNPRCGLFTHVLYEPDVFIERIESDGARLLPPRGTGFGFDDLLEGLPWTSIG